MAKQIETEIKISGQMDASVQKAISSTSKNLSKLDDNVDKAFKSFGKLGKTMTGKVAAGFKKLEKAALVAGAALTTAVAGAAIYGAKKLADLADEFQEVTNIIRIGTGATGEQLKKLETSFDNVYKSLPLSSEAVATAIADINTLTGAEGKALEEFTRKSLDAADMLKVDAKGLYTAAAQSFNAYGIAAEDMAGKLDYVWKVSQTTGAGMQELMETVQKNAATFQALGYTYEESIALVGQMEKAGFETTDAMTALQKAVANMAKLGITDMEKGLETAITRIKEAETETEAAALAIEAFGTKAGPKMAKGIRDGTISVDALVEQLNASPETIEAAADATDTLGDKWTELKHHIEVGLRPALAAITEAVKSFIPVLSDLAVQIMPKVQAAAQTMADYIAQNQDKIKQKIIEFVTSIKDGLVWIYENRDTLIQVAANVGKVYLAIKGVEICAKVWKALTIATKAVTAAVTACKAIHAAFASGLVKQKAIMIASSIAAKAYAAKQWLINAAIAACPIMLIIAGITAVIAILAVLWKNWDKITAWMSKVWQAFANKFPKTAAALEKAWNAVCKAFKYVWDLLCKGLKIAWEGIKAFFVAIAPAFTGIWDGICAAFKTAFDIFVSFFSTTWDNIKVLFSGIGTFLSETWQAVCDLFTGNWDGFTEHFTNAGAAIENTVVSIWTNIKEFMAGVWDALKSGATALWEAISSGFEAAFSGLAALLKTPINAVISVINSAIDGINKIGFTIPDWVPGIGGKRFSVNVPKLPMLAAGGFTDGISIAGEAGTEAVISFDPAHRKENQGYLMTAAEMLGMYAAPKEQRGSTTYNVGGVTFSPVIKTGDNVNKGDLLRQFRACMPDLVDMIESAIKEREGHRYA